MNRDGNPHDNDQGPITLIPGDGEIGAPGLTAHSEPPPAPSAEMSPELLERYMLAGVHQDRSPGNVLVVLHPLKKAKVPRDLLPALEMRGFRTRTVETRPDLAESVEGIRVALEEMSREEKPLDVIVISGDGSLDHHFMVAAYGAFHPDLVRLEPGRVDCSQVTAGDLSSLPLEYREELFAQGAPTGIEPGQATITRLWLLRSRLESAVRARRSPDRLAKLAGLGIADPRLGVVVLSILWPEKVDLVPDHYDLSALAKAGQEETFQGLYPYIRAISCYPAGVAADNAVYAGVPGWTFATAGKLLARWRWLDPFRRRFEASTTRRFVEYFCESGVVVPTRQSAIALDGHWRAVCGHVVSGPAGGHFFTKDLTRKTQTMWGYLIRIPQVILKEGVLGKTRVRVRSFDARGRKKSHAEGHLAEGLYTNRTFIAGVASVPTTNPASFAGASSLLVVTPVWSRTSTSRFPLNVRTFLAFWETIVKGLLARTLHTFGFGTGTLAGGGRLWGLSPAHQVAIKEGERIAIEYQHMDGTPRGVPVVISGDPFQARRMDIQVLWGPLPLLGARRSLLVTGARKTLTNLRMEQSFNLEHAYIGGVRYFRHRTGEPWTSEMSARTGLFQPPLHLPRSLTRSYDLLRSRWQAAGAGEFVDTSKPGLPLTRKGCFAHNNDQTAHLLVLKESGGTLLVRQVRARRSGGIYENRTHYRPGANAFIVQRSQTLYWRDEAAAQIIREAHYFRDAEEFQLDAARFLPIGGAEHLPEPEDRPLNSAPEVEAIGEPPLAP